MDQPQIWVYTSGAAIFALVLIALIIFFIDLGLTEMRPQFIAFYTAAIFVFLSFSISMMTIWSHFANYRNPKPQGYVVRIIALVPLYSIQSWLSLRFHDFALFFGAARDCYEAYVIFSFFEFLLAVQGGPDRVSLKFNAGPSRLIPHTWPLSWILKPWAMGGAGGNNTSDSQNIQTAPFLLQCEGGVLQYVVLKLVLTAVSFLLEWFSLFGEGEFTFKKGWIYISGATNLSQMWAMYCLLRFYSVCSNDLRPVKPVGKLIAVKSVVFFTYSQSCIIAALHWFELLPSAIEETGEHWSTEDVGRALQDYLICIEMLIAAIIFTHVFSHREYKEDLDLDVFDTDGLDDQHSYLLSSHHHHNSLHSTSSSNGSSGGSGGSGSGGGGSGGSMSKDGVLLGSPFKSQNRSRTNSRERDGWWSEKIDHISNSLVGNGPPRVLAARSTTM